MDDEERVTGTHETPLCLSSEPSKDGDGLTPRKDRSNGGRANMLVTIPP